MIIFLILLIILNGYLIFNKQIDYDIDYNKRKYGEYFHNSIETNILVVLSATIYTIQIGVTLFFIITMI